MKEHYNTRDSYKLYKKNTKKPICEKDYITITNNFFKFISNELLVKGVIILPERLGILRVIGTKTPIRIEDGDIKGLAPDWKKTKELWGKDTESKNKKKLIYHFNEDTNGIRYRFFWGTNKVYVENKSLYVLKMTRTIKRALVKSIRNGTEYLIKK